MWARMKSSMAMLKSEKVTMNAQNAREVTMKVKSGYIVQYVINGTNGTHLALLVDYINKSY